MILLPGVNLDIIEKILSSSFFGNDISISHNSLKRVSLFTVGISGYRSAFLLYYILGIVRILPSYNSLAIQGHAGYKRISAYIAKIALPVCIIVGFWIAYSILKMQTNFPGLVMPMNPFIFYLLIIAAVTAGTFFLIWLAEQISVYGIANGFLLIIAAPIASGFISDLPEIGRNIMDVASKHHSSTILFQPQTISLIVLCLVFSIFVISAIYIVGVYYKMPFQYIKSIRNGQINLSPVQHTMPVRVIHPVALVLAIYFTSFGIGLIELIVFYCGWLDVPNWFSYWDNILYSFVVFVLGYLLVNAFLKPEKQIKKIEDSGARITGLTSPGSYLEAIGDKTALFAAAYLAVITIALDLTGEIVRTHLNYGRFTMLSPASWFLVIWLFQDVRQRISLITTRHETTINH